MTDLYLYLKVIKSDIDLERNDDVYNFRMSLIDTVPLNEFDRFPDYDIMVEYNWIPLEIKYWKDKHYKKLNMSKTFVLYV